MAERSVSDGELPFAQPEFPERLRPVAGNPERIQYCPRPITVQKYSLLRSRSLAIIRILCPHCHVSLSASELEQAEINDQRCLLCPDCAAVLVSEPCEAGCQATPRHSPEMAEFASDSQ